jgi:hypothetical protein
MILEIHQKIRQENFKVYLNVLKSNITPFNFDYYDLANKLFFKQGEFRGNHYRYHVVHLYDLLADKPVPWRENAADNSKIPVFKFNSEDCDFGAAPVTSDKGN